MHNIINYSLIVIIALLVSSCEISRKAYREMQEDVETIRIEATHHKDGDVYTQTVGGHLYQIHILDGRVFWKYIQPNTEKK